MKITFDIDEEMLLRVKELQLTYRNGVPVLPRMPNGAIVTSELVDRLLNEDE